MSERDWFPEDNDDEVDYLKCRGCGKRFTAPIDFDHHDDVLCRICSPDYEIPD